MKMIFEDILNRKHEILWPQFEKLYYSILKNQTDDGDLLLVHLNAFYNSEVHAWNNIDEKLSPYMFGPNHEGHSENTHYDFIGHYIENHMSDKSFDEYMKNITYSEARSREIDKINFDESISIQTEMLIYLKIWESDIFIKKFYQLASLLHKEPYDWHVKIMTTNRELGTNGTRDSIIRTKIRDRFKKSVPTLYSSFKNAYNSQIRNSIAHSQYSIMGRNIQINNYIKDDPYSQLKSLSFKDWVDKFHETIVVYTLYHKFLNMVNDNYGAVALTNGNIFPIRIIRKDPVEEFQYLPLYYRDVFKDWGWEPGE